MSHNIRGSVQSVTIHSVVNLAPTYKLTFNFPNVDVRTCISSYSLSPQFWFGCSWWLTTTNTVINAKQLKPGSVKIVRLQGCTTASFKLVVWVQPAPAFCKATATIDVDVPSTSKENNRHPSVGTVHHLQAKNATTKVIFSLKMTAFPYSYLSG